MSSLGHFSSYAVAGGGAVTHSPLPLRHVASYVTRLGSLRFTPVIRLNPSIFKAARQPDLLS